MFPLIKEDIKMILKYLNGALKTRGSMLVGNMIALVILGVSASGLMYYTSTVQRVTKSNIESVEYKPVLKQAMLNNLKSLLIEKNIGPNGELSNENIYGICSLIEEPEVEQGVSDVHLNLSKINSSNNSWGDSRWKHFFPQTEYEFISDTAQCQQKFGDNFNDSNEKTKCLKYTGSDRGEVFALVSWTPKTFPKLEDIDTSNEEQSALDPKEVMFYLKVQLTGAGLDVAVTGSQPEEGEEEAEGEGEEEQAEQTIHTQAVSSQVDMIWANAVGECHVNNTLVKFAGTGLGSTLNDVVINSPYNVVVPDEAVKGGETCETQLKIGDPNPDIVQAGDLGDLTLNSLPNLNVRVSCTRNTFKCKNKLLENANDENDNLSGYDDLQFNFNLTGYLTPSEIPVKSTYFTLKKPRGQQYVEWDGVEDGQLKDANYDFKHRTPSSALKNFDKILNSEMTIQANIRGDGAKKACHSICQNYEPKQKDTYIYPAITITAGEEDSTCSWTKNWIDEDHHNRVRCTVCYTKACHRYGLGTFGPFKEEPPPDEEMPGIDTDNVLRKLPSEALDSQLPECAVEESIDNNTNNTNNDKIQSLSPQNQPTDTDKCVALDITKTNNLKKFNNSQAYSFMNCDEELPVLCFVGGQYRPATEVIKQTDGEIAIELKKAKFNKAQKVCMEMGQEIGKAYDLAILFINMWKGYVDIEQTGQDLQIMTVETIKALPKLGGGQLFNRTVTTPGSVTQGRNFQINLNDINEAEQENQKYDFINNATRGMFLAPPKNPDIAYVTQKMKDDIKAVKDKHGEKMWVAMEADDGGFAMASPPYADVAKDHPFALYFGKVFGKSNTAPPGDPILRGTPITLVKDNTNCPNKANTPPTGTCDNNSKYLALTYNFRWKGLYKEKKDTELPFLCKKSNGQFFVTPRNETEHKNNPNWNNIIYKPDTTKPNQITLNSGGTPTFPGINACDHYGGKFLPPVHSNEWAGAMLALNPNDESLPFPNPVKQPRLNAQGFLNENSFLYKEEIETKSAWVALKLKDDNSGGGGGGGGSDSPSLVDSDGNAILVNKLKLIGDFPADSIFKETDDDNTSIPPFIDGEGKNASINLTLDDLLDPNKRNEELRGYKKLCLNKETVILTPKNLTENCPEEEIEIKDSNLNKYKKSIRFMRAWEDKGFSANNKFILKDLKEICKEKVKENCRNSCNSTYTTCQAQCSQPDPTPNPEENPPNEDSNPEPDPTPNPENPPNEDSNPEPDPTPDPECLNTCATKKAECETKCNNPEHEDLNKCNEL